MRRAHFALCDGHSPICTCAVSGVDGTVVLGRLVCELLPARAPALSNSMCPELCLGLCFQGWMAEALIPFQSHEEMVAHSEGRPTADDPTSFYPDEIDDDGVITRRPHSAAGQVDMSDWASVLRASARARAAAADAPDSAAAEATAPGVEGARFAFLCRISNICAAQRMRRATQLERYAMAHPQRKQSCARQAC